MKTFKIVLIVCMMTFLLPVYERDTVSSKTFESTSIDRSRLLEPTKKYQQTESVFEPIGESGVEPVVENQPRKTTLDFGTRFLPSFAPLDRSKTDLQRIPPAERAAQGTAGKSKEEQEGVLVKQMVPTRPIEKPIVVNTKRMTKQEVQDLVSSFEGAIANSLSKESSRVMDAKVNALIKKIKTMDPKDVQRLTKGFSRLPQPELQPLVACIMRAHLNPENRAQKDFVPWSMLATLRKKSGLADKIDVLADHIMQWDKLTDKQKTALSKSILEKRINEPFETEAVQAVLYMKFKGKPGEQKILVDKILQYKPPTGHGTSRSKQRVSLD